MIDLINIDGIIRLQCSIDSYEFPDSSRDNWCKVLLKIHDRERNFSVVDPALTTNDLVRLSEWFQCLASNKLPKFACQSFTEPNLEFCFLGANEQSVRISINLRLEMKPNFELVQLSLTSDDWNLVFELNSCDFQNILAGLDDAIQKFPTRNESSKI